MSLRELLAAHRPVDEKEAADLALMGELARHAPAALLPHHWPAHFTGSAVVVSPDGGRVCLVFHAMLQRWLQPGGHVEAIDSGSLLATALREAAEETGCRVSALYDELLDVDVHVIPARKDQPQHRHFDLRFLLVAADPEALTWNPLESHGAQWFNWDAALKVADEAPLQRMLSKARRESEARLRRPIDGG
jgi:8-oxo-dGTP pyrophosphatase MutT (NUDIX family)